MTNKTVFDVIDLGVNYLLSGYEKWGLMKSLIIKLKYFQTQYFGSMVMFYLYLNQPYHFVNKMLLTFLIIQVYLVMGLAQKIGVTKKFQV